ncbi:MAG: hypothetical protein NC485_15010 [Ruminococcus flavefaciens]|nr:hypothetical protein [Ruminococcus flavefaciens]MCM1062668.1 hypothetical protein [Eubacterium sp.]
MELLRPTSFASSVESSKDILKKISVIISRYCGEEAANEFLISCDKPLNPIAANKILDKTIEILTGCSSVPIALTILADKFPQLNPKLSDELSLVMSEEKMVRIIDKYFDQIIEIMR